ncbi:RNA polymerase subunit sigma [Lysinibacillus sp. 54212]|uniref:RNA polymerase subunit sigma n=1 Tax=Lysinibacillus sp. 54212 TaxID=3119829 RepID=UPI002FC6ACB9
MSLKGIELQIAIPKTFDAGKIADQHQQNTIHQQMNANEALKKEIERKQLAVNDTEDMDAISEEEEREGNASNQSMLSKKKDKEQEKQTAKHPFKGNFIDFSG